MEKLERWRLCEALNVRQATLLILGLDPDDYLHLDESVSGDSPDGFNPTIQALIRAIKNEQIPAEIIIDFDEVSVLGELQLQEITDWSSTTILVDDLRSWLRERGSKPKFFFPQEKDTLDFLDPAHDHYAPKLAAAIYAWQAVNSDPKLTVGKTVKQALQKWLRIKADQFGLTKDDGTPNEQGIEEISKISNWDTKGGSPKTPG